MKTASTKLSPLPAAALTALGIVYGDLGTSPLYTLQTVVEAFGARFTPESALGVLSLIIWTLIIIVSVKYALLVMRADNHGEGGILALMSLVGSNRGLAGPASLLTAAGLLGAALIYGDGAITPSISVLSALEGVNAATNVLSPYVMPLAVLILAGLFATQRLGTDSIGRAFGPVMLVWFLVIALLGLYGVVKHPAALLAIDPRHAIWLLAHAHGAALAVLGGVFLCVTGAEALYADMGHVGAGPIRLSWYGLVLPALLLNYAGQTGLLIEQGQVHGNPFFLMAPSWSLYPLVALATLATIIASQAIITGSFSMTRQAIQLGWLPGLKIRQTSDRVYGQIYVPVVNGLMMVTTLAITVGFGSSLKLAGAYGVAVSTTMLMTTVLLFNAMRDVWRWPIFVAAAVAGVFLIVDSAFFVANLTKILDGGWLPLTLGGAIFFVMTTWRTGVEASRASQREESQTPEAFLSALKRENIARVPGVAIFLTRLEKQIPDLLVEYVRRFRSLHARVIIVNVKFEEAPRVPDDERSAIESLEGGVCRVMLRYGFVEIPDIPRALAQVKGLEPTLDLTAAVYFGARDMVVRKTVGSRMAGWRLMVFAWLYTNAVRVIDRFNLPPKNVIEIARQIEI